MRYNLIMKNSKTYLRMNDEALNWLIDNFSKVDENMSSLWKKQALQFKYKEGWFEGLTGFGTYEPPVNGIKSFAHWLLQFPYRKIGKGYTKFKAVDVFAREIAKKSNRNYNLDILRQAITLAYLIDKVGNQLDKSNSTILVIGDGFGTFTSLVLSMLPKCRVVMINLTKVLLVDVVYMSKSMSDTNFAIAYDKESMREALNRVDIRVIAIRADDTKLLKMLDISLAVNMVGMQEMNPPVIAEYFDAMRKSKGDKPIFYCCNREEKMLIDGTVVNFNDYPWASDDEVLVDELCPWNQDYYATRPPMYRPYDGPIRHRLVKLTT